MANWFKLYETDLDETRMKFALNKLPEVWPVWTAVLMECCRHRKDSFPWGSDEQELFGFSDRLKISIPKVNLAVSILCEIKYVEVFEGVLKVLKWNEKQDDYLARKSRGYWENRRETQNLTVNHCESHIEERRGEEIRGEDKREEGKGVASLPRFQKPTLEMVKLQGAKIGLPDPEAEKFFNYYESNGWRVGRNPMKSWTHALTNWKNNAPQYARNNSGKSPAENPRNFGMPSTGKQAGERAVAELKARGGM